MCFAISTLIPFERNGTLPLKVMFIWWNAASKPHFSLFFFFQSFHFQQKSGKGFVFRIINMCGPNARAQMFIFSQLIFTIITYIQTYFMIRYQWYWHRFFSFFFSNFLSKDIFFIIIIKLGCLLFFNQLQYNFNFTFSNDSISYWFQFTFFSFFFLKKGFILCFYYWCLLFAHGMEPTFM